MSMKRGGDDSEQPAQWRETLHRGDREGFEACTEETLSS